jgi:hypothetical protein
MASAVAELEMQTSLRDDEASASYPVPRTIAVEQTVYLISRRQEVPCRLWYEVSPLREGLMKYFLVGIQELDK